MSKGNTTENDVLKANLAGVDPAWRANPSRFIALHTADPGEAGNQSTTEATYTGYARIPIAVGAWTDGGSTFTNMSLLQFAQCTAGTNTITHVSIGTVASGAGQVIYKGPLASSLSVSNGIQPQFAASALSVTED